MTPDFTLTGRIAVVTGAGRGIGRALALGLAGAGAAIVVAEQNEERAAATTTTIATAGGTAVAAPCDVADRHSVDTMVAKAMDQFGQVDILVNNAGVTSTYHVLDLPEAEWDRVLNVNLKGVFLCSQAIGRVMATAGSGVIINISSQLGDVVRPNKAHYVSAKGGVKQLTKALAVDLAPHGIRVNAVAPGPIETELAAPLLSDPVQRAAFLERLPLGRLGQPNDLVGAVLFLASEAAAFITGTTLYVDGGYLTM
jgi:2-deoxy-D-gluconate 3-dehydrogenase